MAEKTILIIGAGIAGLAAGCYGQMNGYRTKIFELHDLPGGLCTAWERKEYVFDGCIHYLYGSGEGQPFNDIWQELGAVQGREMINHDEFMHVVGTDGRTFIAYCDPDRLENHLKELVGPNGQADYAHIEDFAQGIRDFASFDMSALQAKPRSLMGPSDWLIFNQKMLPFMGPLAKWGLVSAQDFAMRYKDPLLRQALSLVFGWPEIPMMAALMQLAYMHTRNAAFPAGGSLEFARAIERRYLDLGGEIFYKSQVEKILVENDQAVGVRLYNDDEIRGDYVISSADARGTIFDMLGGRYTNGAINRMFEQDRPPIHSQIQVSLGVKRDLSAEPHWATYLLDKPVLIAGQERGDIGVKHYCFDPSLAPQGKSSVVVMIRSYYGYWQRIYGRRLYDTEQLQVGDIVVEQLEKIYPGLSSEIEVNDVATPLSYERYTGNWLGSTCGWLLTKKTMRMMLTGVKKTLPGLDNFYLAGQWVEPGGSLPLAATSGRNAIQRICHEDRRPFETTIP